MKNRYNTQKKKKSTPKTGETQNNTLHKNYALSKHIMHAMHAYHILYIYNIYKCI